MSFGVYWTDEGFRLLPETVENITYRMEYEELLVQYPKLDEMLETRWRELRKTVFSEENIFGMLNEYYMTLDKSGAVERDFFVLGWYSWGNEDTRAELNAYIQRRLQILDEHYGLE